MSAINGLRLLILLPVSAIAGEVTLMWTAPTQNTDGSPLTDLAGFRLYARCESDGDTGYPRGVTLDNPALTSYEWEDLPAEVCVFVSTAVNEQGVESGFSNQAMKDLSQTVPNPPESLSVLVETTAYEISEATDSLALLPIGTVPAGTPCLGSITVGGLYVVPRGAVVLASEFIGLPQTVVAACSGG